MALRGGNKVKFTWSGASGASDENLLVGEIIAGTNRNRRQRFDTTPIDSTSPRYFMSDLAVDEGFFRVNRDTAAPGVRPPSGQSGTLTIFFDTDAESTNKKSGSAFIEEVTSQWTSLDGGPPQTSVYRYVYTGSVTHTNPS